MVSAPRSASWPLPAIIGPGEDNAIRVPRADTEAASALATTTPPEVTAARAPATQTVCPPCPPNPCDPCDTVHIGCPPPCPAPAGCEPPSTPDGNATWRLLRGSSASAASRHDPCAGIARLFGLMFGVLGSMPVVGLATNGIVLLQSIRDVSSHVRRRDPESAAQSQRAGRIVLAGIAANLLAIPLSHTYPVDLSAGAIALLAVSSVCGGAAAYINTSRTLGRYFSPARV